MRLFSLESWLSRVLAALFLVMGFALAGHGLSMPGHRTILEAIRQVESSGRLDVPDGDGGKAIGPFQIHLAYWQDAVAFSPELGPAAGYRYEDCRRLPYAELIVRSYMQRHAALAWFWRDAETIARIHNGGPRGHKKAATLPYWAKVRAHLAAPR